MEDETEGDILTTYKMEYVPQAKETGKPWHIEEQRKVWCVWAIARDKPIAFEKTGKVHKGQ